MATKAAEIGPVPEHWNVVPLVTYLELITYGFTNPMPDTEVGPWKITAKDVVDGNIDYTTARHTSQDAFDNLLTQKSKPKVGDVLLTKDGSIGRVAVVERDGICINQSVALLRPNQKIHPFFLKYLLLTPHYQRVMERDSDGSTIKHIYITRVDKMQVAVPPTIDEQEAVLNIVKSLDDKIELNRCMNETLETIARAMFKSWFVDFDPVRAKASGEPPESICRRLGLTPDLLALFPDRFVDSELGEIPEGWSVAPLSKVCTRITDGSHSSPKSVQEGRPMASVKDMENWGFQLSGCRRISEVDYQELIRNDCRPLANDVLIAKDGSYLKHIFVVERDLDVVILSSIAILRPNENIVPHYLAFTLKSGAALARMEQYVSGAVLQRIVLKAFREFPIVLPPRVVQNAWDKIAGQLIQTCWRNVGQNGTLTEMRDALLPKLLSGELSRA
jgi:type I restriction enzyme, S subunit